MADSVEFPNTEFKNQRGIEYTCAVLLLKNNDIETLFLIIDLFLLNFLLLIILGMFIVHVILMMMLNQQISMNLQHQSINQNISHIISINHQQHHHHHH
jgi:hypothetical protein